MTRPIRRARRTARAPDVMRRARTCTLTCPCCLAGESGCWRYREGPALAEMSDPKSGQRRSLEPYRCWSSRALSAGPGQGLRAAWDDSAAKYPHLLVTAGDVERIRKQAGRRTVWPAGKAYLTNPTPST